MAAPMSTCEEADDAIKALNKHKFEDSSLIVDVEGIEGEPHPEPIAPECAKGGQSRIMDISYDAPNSEGSTEDDWMDLSQSDYAKVIFSNLYWNSESGDVGCYFACTETVNRNLSDYIGIYKVGYDSLSQCLAMKKLSDFQFEDDSKPIQCGFSSDELPELNGFYQFLYVTHENEVCGASTPFEVRHSPQKKQSSDEVVTERIENDFLMVRYGVEHDNFKLKTILKTYEAENVVLISQMKELRRKEAGATFKLEQAEKTLASALQELKQLKAERQVLATELEVEKGKVADALLAHDSAEMQYAQEYITFRASSKKTIGELESKYKKAVDYYEKRTAALAVKLEEKYTLTDSLRKTIEELKDEISAKQAEIEKIREESEELMRAKDSIIQEYKGRVDQLCSQMEKLTSELISKENLLKSLRNGDRERVYNMMEIDLQNALRREKALEKELKAFKTYQRNLPFFLETPNVRNYSKQTKYETLFDLRPASEERLIFEQLEDAKFMIKALEDSKQLAMKEMHELAEKLKRTKEELSQMRCENMALKIFLDEKSSTSPSTENESNSEKQADNFQMFLSKLKETDPTVNAENLEGKITDLFMNAQHQTEEIKKGKAELSLLRCENMALKIFLEDKSCKSSEEKVQNRTLREDENSDKSIQVDDESLLSKLIFILKEVDPTLSMDNLEENLEELVANVYKQAEKIKKFKEECKAKEDEIESLNEKMQMHEKTALEAIADAQDKTARIVQAAELYKDLYKEKEKLAKRLRKLMLMKSRSKKSSFSKSQENSGSLALNIEQALASSETTSNNSDSDTGEHVRTQVLYPDLQKDENYIEKQTLPLFPVTVETQVKPIIDFDSIDVAINNLCVDVKEDQVYKAPSKMDSLTVPLSVEQDTHIPCLIYGQSFLVTPHSNIPMMDHMEREHNMAICPICGQMFDKSFPTKYLMFHINDHFQSE